MNPQSIPRYAWPDAFAGRGRLQLSRQAGDLNRAIGFTSLLLCVVSGMVIGLWSFGGPFPTPESIGGYGELPRRFIRLGHIAFFGIGILNIMLAAQSSRLPWRHRTQAQSLMLMNWGNVGLPPLLIAAAWQPQLLYLMPIPVLCILAALGLAVVAAWRGWVFSRPSPGGPVT